MALSLTTAAVALFYLSAIPVKLVLCLRFGPNAGFGLGMAVFEARFARKIALHRQDNGGKMPSLLRKPDLASAVKSLLRAADFAMKHLRLDELSLDGAFGSHDAALTALVCSGLNALGCALGASARRTVRISLRPDFAADRLSGELSGMISIRVGHIMLAALLGAFEYASGRFNQWISTPLRAS